MGLSQTRRAINERRRRVNQREKRRRSVFVHDYVRTKYTDIYNECNIFYQELSEKYPEKPDLTRSKEYKKWKRQTTDGSQSESGIVAETITRDQRFTEADIAAENISGESTATTGNFEEPDAENMAEPTPSILQVAVQELLPASPITIENMDRIIDEIIRDLEQDEQIRDLMPDLQSDNEEDEGIELNIESELNAIVEPFDYELEVEGVDW